MAKGSMTFKTKMFRQTVDRTCVANEVWLGIIHPDREEVKQFVNEATTNGFETEYEITIKKASVAKSLNANSYCWVLLHKLAVVTGISKETIYRELVTDVGDNYEVVPVKDAHVDNWIRIWEHVPETKVGWVCKILGPSLHPGYTNVICYYGSSTFTGAQMSRLIDLVVEECRIQGVDTTTPDEIERLKSEWEKYSK